jgi:threonine 3-dehydrogenase
MMYMPDCLRATWELIMAPLASLRRTTYNLTAMSFTPREQERSIQAVSPDFKVRCVARGARLAVKLPLAM